MISKCAHIVHTFNTNVVVQGAKVDRGIHLKFINNDIDNDNQSKSS